MKPSQSERILSHLLTGARLTPLDALRLCGSLACHSRIAELRARGHDIRCDLVTEGRKRYGSYYLVRGQLGLFGEGLQPLAGTRHSPAG